MLDKIAGNDYDLTPDDSDALQRFYEREILQQPQESQPNVILYRKHGLEKAKNKVMNIFFLVVSFFRVLIWLFYHPRDAAEKAKDKFIQLFFLVDSFFKVLISLFIHPCDAVKKANNKVIHLFRRMNGLEKNLQKRLRNASMYERFTLAVVLLAVMIFAIFLPRLVTHTSSFLVIVFTYNIHFTYNIAIFNLVNFVINKK